MALVGGSSWCLLLLLFVYPAVTKIDNCPAEYLTVAPYFNTGYSSVYLKFEEALIKNKDALEELRASFISPDISSVVFELNIEVKNLTSTAGCGVYDGNRAFCRSDQDWVLCEDCLPQSAPFMQLRFIPHVHYKLKTEQNKQTITQSIAVLSLTHGSLLSIYVAYYYLPSYPFQSQNEIFALTLEAANWTCNPSCLLTKCVMSELFSWIKVYSFSESGRKPQTWDLNQKGTVIIGNGYYDYYYYDYDDRNFVASTNKDLTFMTLKVTESIVAWLGVGEYMISSLSLALLIAKFFPAVHNQIVSKATRLEYQSLYWGTAVVSNIFVNTLFSWAIRGWSISVAMKIGYDYQIMEFLLPIPEIVIVFIFFVAALMDSLRRHHGVDVCIPEGMAMIMIKMSFCVCCDTRCTEKALRVMVIVGFMSFIHHRIMDAISIAFLLFIENSRVAVVTLTLLYISFIIFLVLFISFSILILFRSRHTNLSPSRQFSYWFGGLFMLISIFISVVMMVFMYEIVVMSLNLKGVTGILTGLIPSVVLLAASWYIKKRLDKEMNTTQLQYGTTGGAMNEGEGEETEDSTDDQRLLMP